jgi:hypothetical protein
VISLCGECAEYEKKRIDKAQTNSIPELLKIYIHGTGLIKAKKELT